MTHTITLKMRNKKTGKERIISIEMDKDHATIEEVAELLAEKSARMYNTYLRGKMDKNKFRRYKFGQYKLILHLLEASPVIMQRKQEDKRLFDGVTIQKDIMEELLGI